MESIIILITNLLFIIKFEICNSANTYHQGSCGLGWDCQSCSDCAEWCTMQESNSICRFTKRTTNGCVLYNRCNCECFHKDPLSPSAEASTPFEIKHRATGKCIEWLYSVNGQVQIRDCNDKAGQKWIYYKDNGAVVSAHDTERKYDCLNVIDGNTENGNKLGIWMDNDCVNWEPSQWTFYADGHIKCDIGNKYVDMIDTINVRPAIWGFATNQNQIFDFPAGTLRGKSRGQCKINKLERIAETSTNELAETAWNLGTTAAGMIPVVGDAVGIITSIWDPTEDDGPSQEELINNVREEINAVVNQLKECMDSKITNLDLKWQEKDAQDYITKIMTQLASIRTRVAEAKIEAIENLFLKFNTWIETIFKTKNNHLEYENLLPMYETLVPLWAVVSQEQLVIRINENDCHNYNSDLGDTRARFNTFRDWIGKAIESILKASIQIISDGNSYNQWKSDQNTFMNNKYFPVIDFFMEALDDISPNLAMDTSKCKDDYTFPTSTDSVINIYKYTKSNGDTTLSASQSSKIIKSRGFTLDDDITYKLYDKKKDNTLPVYKKYRFESNVYAITTYKDYGKDENFKIVSVLGYCSTLPNNDVTTCDDIQYPPPIQVSWTQVNGPSNGALKQVSIGEDSTIVGVDYGDRIWKYNEASPSWSLISETSRLKQISVQHTYNIWGVNSIDDIWSYTNNNQWTHIPGKLKHVSVGSDGTVWGVDANDQIYRYDLWLSWESNKWTQISGELSQISVGSKDHIIGVNSLGEIWKLSVSSSLASPTNTPWTMIENPNNIIFKYVDISFEGDIFAIDTNDRIYHYKLGWMLISGNARLKQMESVNGIIIGVNSANEIYKGSYS